MIKGEIETLKSMSDETGAQMTNVRLSSCSEEAENSNIAKKPKTVEIDMISCLPDELISHILSFLSTKDAVKTSVLSKRWRSLWALVPILNFSSGSSKETKGFMRFFRKRVRTLGRSLAIVRLRGKFGPYFGNWVSKIIASGVRELDLCMMGAKPRKIFRHGSLTSKALVSLRLEKVSFDVPLSVHLPSLKTLHLQFFGYPSEESISQFISGCPVIEDVLVSNSPLILVLPLSLFASQTLVSLKGYEVSFAFPSSINLSHLKILHLRTHVNALNHEVMSLLLSQCTLLEDLDLKTCCHREPIKVPDHLFVSKTLVSLKLRGTMISLHVPPSVCLPNLRILHLGCSVLMLDKLIGDLLSGCPVLEEIDLRYLYTTNIESSSTCVMTSEHLWVTLGRRDHPLPNMFKITAPTLKQIRISSVSGDLIAWNFPNLQEASVSFEHKISRNFFSAIRNAKVLKLYHYFYNFGHELPPLKIDLIPKFQHLKCLWIYNSISLAFFLPEILENSANLQKLIIAGKSDPLDVAWSTPQSVPHCLLHSLKAFGIFHFQGLGKETQMVDYILTNGRILEKIIVRFFTSDSDQKLRAQEKLSAIPRSSRTSQLKFI